MQVDFSTLIEVSIQFRDDIDSAADYVIQNVLPNVVPESSHSNTNEDIHGKVRSYSFSYLLLTVKNIKQKNIQLISFISFYAECYFCLTKTCQNSPHGLLDSIYLMKHSALPCDINLQKRFPVDLILSLCFLAPENLKCAIFFQCFLIWNVSFTASFARYPWNRNSL
jgi:hypothetical protein